MPKIRKGWLLPIRSMDCDWTRTRKPTITFVKRFTVNGEHVLATYISED